MAATYVTGYRVAILAAGAGALHIAALQDWSLREPAAEKAAKGKTRSENEIFRDLPPALPALLYALDIYKRAAKAGLAEEGAWDDAEVAPLAESLTEETVGEELFLLVAACRQRGIDPESALRRYVAKVVEELGSGVTSENAP